MQQAMEYIDYTDQVQVDYSHLQKSKLKFKKGQRAKSVYHYTSIGGLESILRNKTLRFTNIKYMNDKDEIIAGLDSIAKIAMHRTKCANKCVWLLQILACSCLHALLS